MEFPSVKCALLVLLALPSLSPAEDWPRFLGPDHDGRSAETGLRKSFPETGLAVVWQTEHGRSHTSPSIAAGHLVFTHLLGGEEIIQCHDPATGALQWKYARPVQAGSNYGISDAPRSSPVIDAEAKLVYTVGMKGDLTCLRLESGEKVWERNLDRDFGEAPFFFGRGSCPLFWNGQLLLNTGGRSCVVSLDPKTGDLLWETKHEWHASYASPIPARIHDRDVLLVFAGGMTNPPTGGLLCIDPANGTLFGSHPWRARGFASVNAASPVVTGNSVFLTEGYDRGGALLDLDKSLKPALRWEASRFACQFSTPIADDGHLYGFSGSSEAGSELVCYEIATGEEKWRHGMTEEVRYQGSSRKVFFGRGSLLSVDGSYLALGEQGTLAWLDLSPKGVDILALTQLFLAPETWGTPALSNGLLYVVQNSGEKRLLCYDLRPKP